MVNINGKRKVDNETRKATDGGERRKGIKVLGCGGRMKDKKDKRRKRIKK